MLANRFCIHPCDDKRLLYTSSSSLFFFLLHLTYTCGCTVADTVHITATVVVGKMMMVGAYIHTLNTTQFLDLNFSSDCELVWKWKTTAAPTMLLWKCYAWMMITIRIMFGIILSCAIMEHNFSKSCMHTHTHTHFVAKQHKTILTWGYMRVNNWVCVTHQFLSMNSDWYILCRTIVYMHRHFHSRAMLSSNGSNLLYFS